MTLTSRVSRADGLREIGAASRYDTADMIRADEFLQALRGQVGAQKYREMRDNDPTIGGALMAFELLLRSAKVRFDPADDSSEAEEAVEFVEGMFDDMEHTLDDFLGQATTFLGFGYSLFEKVWKVRKGRTGNPATHSKYDDGLIGYRKLAPRAQWTVDRWLKDENGVVVGVRQHVMPAARFSPYGQRDIPLGKLVHFRTATMNEDPSGRSVLRNAYLSYHYASHIDMIEAIGIERELNGIPLIKLPSEFFAADATADQKAFLAQMEKIGRDVKNNDQGFIMISSDPWLDAEGKAIGDAREVEFELVSAQGTRAIPTGDTINRHRKNIAASILADFLTLGQDERGSFALSKNKTDLFLAAAMAYADNIAATINRDVIEPVWQVNGFDPEMMPKTAFDDIAPADLAELGAFLRDASAAGMPLFPDLGLENTLRTTAGFPERSEEDDPDLLGVPDDPDQQGGDQDDPQNSTSAQDPNAEG